MHHLRTLLVPVQGADVHDATGVHDAPPSLRATRAAALRTVQALRHALDLAEVSARGNDPELAALDIQHGLREQARDLALLYRAADAYRG